MEGRLRAIVTLVASLLVALAITEINDPPFSWRSVASNAVVKLGAFVFFAGLAWISWWIAGGRVSFSNFVTACSYLFAVWLLIFSLLIGLDGGLLRLAKPELFAAIAAAGSSGQDTQRLKALVGPEGTYEMKVLMYSDRDFADAIQTPGFFWIGWMAVLRGVFTFGWLIVAWAIFRRVFAVAWSRAVFSLATFLCFGLVAGLLAVFFQMAPIDMDPGRWLEKWPLLRRLAQGI
jgi:hypothetical protein